MKFVLLCHGSLNDDIADWQLAATDDSVAELQKGEVFTVSDLVDEINKGGEIPTGRSWSAELQSRNPSSRWVTLRGSKVLLKSFNEGGSDEYGIVVYSEDKRLSHIKVIPTTNESYSTINKGLGRWNAERTIL